MLSDRPPGKPLICKGNCLSAKAASPGAHAGLEIDVRWVMRELLDEGRVSREDYNVISTTPREKQEMGWHPLQIVAKYRIADRGEKGGILDLDRLTAWLAGRAGVPVFHIDPDRKSVV